MPSVVALPLPNSWYAVAFSADLRPGALAPWCPARWPSATSRCFARAAGWPACGTPIARIWAREFYLAETAAVAMATGVGVVEAERAGG
jgi:hypothetical protein